MKTYKYLLSLLMAALCVVSFTSCENEDEEQTEPQFNDYFKANVTRCERVGTYLIVDFWIVNKSKKDVQNFTFDSEWDSYNYNTVDNLGNKYDEWESRNISINGSLYGTTSKLSILAGDTLKCSIRIPNFDTTNSATSLTSFAIRVACSDFSVAYQYVTWKNLPISDNRVLSRGIQTNATKLSWTMVSNTIDSEGNLITTFRVKNNTGCMLKSFTINNPYSYSYTDNLGQSYSASGICISGGSYNDTKVSTDFEKDATLTYSVKTKNFNENSSSISCDMEVTCTNYPLEDKCVHFLNVAVN